MPESATAVTWRLRRIRLNGSRARSGHAGLAVDEVVWRSPLPHMVIDGCRFFGGSRSAKTSAQRTLVRTQPVITACSAGQGMPATKVAASAVRPPSPAPVELPASNRLDRPGSSPVALPANAALDRLPRWQSRSDVRARSPWGPSARPPRRRRRPAVRWRRLARVPPRPGDPRGASAGTLVGDTQRRVQRDRQEYRPLPLTPLRACTRRSSIRSRRGRPIG
jgi:hypothetical protein